MNKLTVLILLAVGMMVVSCKKEDPVTPSPSSNTGTLVISIKYKGSLIVTMEDSVLYNSPSGTAIERDTTLSYVSPKDSTRFDAAFSHYNYPTEIKVSFNGITLIDSVLPLSSTPKLLGFTYFTNRQFYFN